MKVMAGTATPVYNNFDFIYRKNPNLNLNSLFFFTKKNQNPAGSTASQRTFAILTKTVVGIARITAERA